MGSQINTPAEDHNAPSRPQTAPGAPVDDRANAPVRNGGMIDDTRIDEGDEIEEPARDMGDASGNVERADRSVSGERGIE